MTCSLEIAYVTVGKADDVHEWSGLNAAIRGAIRQQGCAVSDVDQLGAEYPVMLRLRAGLMRQLGSVYALERSPHAAERWSRIASEKIRRLVSIDAVVSTSTLPVSRLDTGVPLAIWADATFHSLRTSYPEYANYSQASIDEGDALEQAALNRAAVLCYASQWAADDAVRYYGVPSGKVRVIEFGANAESPFADDAAAAAAVAARDWSSIHLAFIGVDWVRKGGQTAVEAVRCLNDAGVPSVLTIAGCEPPADVAALPFVRSLGFLSKKNANDRTRLQSLLRTSHVLLMPTTAECFGLVFAEAAAHAVPSISRDVGGVGSAITHQRTGLLVPAGEGAVAYCNAIRELIANRDLYQAMAIEAYRDFRDRLNWNVAGSRFTRELRDTLGRAERQA